MKIICAQINATVGDIDGNVKKIGRFIQKARVLGGDLVIFPELAVIGYPPRDLLELPHMIEKCQRGVEALASQVRGMAVVVGSVEVNPTDSGKSLFNAAYWLEEGKIRHIARKSLLPFYDVFDEIRYFHPGNSWEPIDYRGYKIGMTVCEDIWGDSPLWKRAVYDVDPAQRLVEKGANLLINISASPYSMGKYILREKIVAKLAGKHRVPLVYVNQVGGNDELIFDGGSMVMNARGELLARGAFFKEDILLVDVEKNSPVEAEAPQELTLLEQALVCGLRDYVKKCGFKKVALGLSGGIDSALVAHLVVKALGPQNVLGLIMPSRYSSRESATDALALARNLRMRTKTVSIQSMHSIFEKSFQKMFGKKKPDTTEENIQARIRGNLLMAISNKEGYLVLSTGNKSELAVGYCTLYGDMSGGLAVISDLPKTLVYQLARFMNKKTGPIPEAIFVRPPTAELKPNQTDQDTLPPYEILDGILKASVEDLKSPDEIIKMGYDKKVVTRVTRMIQQNEYKRRQAAPGLRVTSKAFGMGRRFPIACKF